MNPKPSRRPNRDPLCEADERAIDALIGEVQQFTPTPPDLTEAILRQLAGQDWAQDNSSRDASVPTISRALPRAESAITERRRRSVLISVVCAGAIAASALVLLSRWERAPQNGSQTASNAPRPPHDNPVRPSNPSLAEATPRSVDVVAANEVPAVAVAPKSRPREGLPLVRNQPAIELSDAPENHSSEERVVANQQPVSMEGSRRLTEFNQSLATYWSRLGVTPAALLNETELSSRVKDRFGASPALASKEDCSQLASRLVERLLRDIPLQAEAREKMLDQATLAIENGDRFDELVSRWVADDSLLDRRKPEQLAQGLATNLLGVDATCAHCHDSPVDGRFAQHDFWSLAAVFAPADRSQLFYELADGRQRIAEPRLPERWMGESANDQTSDLTDLKIKFSKALVGNRALAGAIANRIWEVGFGAPLVSLASDPLAPPRDDALQTSHAMLTDAILASQFDIRVATRLVMASDAMQRGQSELFASGRWRVASEAAIIQESLAQRTFAAAAPSIGKTGRDHILAMMEARIGTSPRELGTSPAVLAQPSISDTAPAPSAPTVEKPRPEEYLWAQWIADRELLRDSWLHWIENQDQQQRHALYAANINSLNNEAELLKRLSAPSDNEAIAADNANDRLLWVLRKSR